METRRLQPEQIPVLRYDPVATETVLEIFSRISKRGIGRNVNRPNRTFELRPLQRKAELVLLTRNDRQVLWIYNEEEG